MSETENQISDPGLWAQFKENRETLLGIQAVVIILNLIVTGPFLALFLSRAITTSGKVALSDTDIASFLLNPTSILLALIFGALAITINVYGYAAQLVTVHASCHGFNPTAPGSLSRAGAHLPAILSLAFRFLIRSTLLCSPFIAAAVGVLYIQLHQNDINYYLDKRPPEFLWACALSLTILGFMAVLLIHRAIAWYYTIPLVLFGREKPAAARRISRDSCPGTRIRIITALVLWLVGTPLLISLTDIPWPPLALKLTELFSHRLGILALALGLILLFSSAIAILIAFISLSLLSIHNVRLFREIGLDRDEPPPPLRTLSLEISWKVFVSAAIVALLVTVTISYRMIDRLQVEDNAIVIAHRGASTLAPENTLAAIDLAINANADWVEIDVQETEAGDLVVIHDADFMRLANNPLKVRESTAEQRATIDVGSWMKPSFAEERAPSLRQVLDLCRDRAGLLIELKLYGQEKQLEQGVIDLVEEMGMEDQIMIMSLNSEAIIKVRELRPSWRIGLLSTVAIGDLTKLDIDFLGLNAATIEAPILKKAKANGIDVYAWTVNDPTAMSALLSIGVDGLITDVPGLCSKVLREREALNPGERLLIGLASKLGRPAPQIEQ